jgi:preprotein translocase subunit SecG
VFQKTTGNGLFTSSQTNPFMSGSEITHLVTKITVVFITIFFVNTLILAKLSYISTSAKKNLLTQEMQQETSQLPSSQSSVPLS